MNSIGISQGQSLQSMPKLSMQTNAIQHNFVKAFHCFPMNRNVKVCYHSFVIINPQRQYLCLPCLTSGPFSLIKMKLIKGYSDDNAIGLNLLKSVFTTQNELVLTF